MYRRIRFATLWQPSCAVAASRYGKSPAFSAIRGYKTTERYAKFGADHLSEAVRTIESYFDELRTLGVALPSPALRVSGVLEKRKGLGGVDPKPLISLVEPTGIEPVTSTMPL